jgi:hypothetical protein
MRSLADLLGIDDIYAQIHRQFSYILKSSARRRLEKVTKGRRAGPLYIQMVSGIGDVRRAMNLSDIDCSVVEGSWKANQSIARGIDRWCFTMEKTGWRYVRTTRSSNVFIASRIRRGQENNRFTVVSNFFFFVWFQMRCWSYLLWLAFSVHVVFFFFCLFCSSLLYAFQVLKL